MEKDMYSKGEKQRPNVTLRNKSFFFFIGVTKLDLIWIRGFGCEEYYFIDP
jgi:hypothetical protein